MEMSTTIGALSADLAKAQSEIKGALKDSANPFFKSKYADLSSVWEACRAPLTNHGLAVIQTVSGDSAAVVVTTMLCHASGEWVRDSMTLSPTKPDPQGVGSTITYARRYALAAIAGVAPEDDDGNAASKTVSENKFINKQQAANVEALCIEVNAKKSEFLRFFGAETFDRIIEADFQRAVKMLEAKRAQKVKNNTPEPATDTDTRNGDPVIERVSV